jgi:hypothetical protein
MIDYRMVGALQGILRHRRPDMSGRAYRRVSTDLEKLGHDR